MTSKNTADLIGRQHTEERERLLDELREAHVQSTADLEATSRLMNIGSLFLHDGSLVSILGEIVDTAIAISEADFGNIQLLAPTGELTIVAHRGFPTWWLEFWNSVTPEQGACGTALGKGERVITEDVARDPVFAGTPALEIQLAAGVRAVQSTPIIGRAGKPIGMLSTHYKVAGRPKARCLYMLDLLARQTADILERARAEGALRDSEARFRALASASSVVLYRMSPDWSELREISAVAPAPFVTGTETTTRDWLDRYVLPEDHPHVTGAIAEAIRTKSLFELEHRVRRADGTVGWTWSRAVPVTNDDGEVVEWFGAANDVTDRKRAELALAEANLRLLEADRRKNEFLAVLSHELRNPLAPIRTSLDLLGGATSGSELERRADAVLRRQFAHLTRLIEDLLDVTRITSGKVSLQCQIVDLGELVLRTVEDHRRTFADHDITLELSAAPTDIRVDADPTRLAQVIGNLLQNAVKFTARGGTTSVLVDAQHGQARIVVRDTGRGIAPEILPRLFEPFTQADRTLDRQMGGLGLGLTLARGLVELHHGSITAASDGRDRGSTFTITLPRDASVPAASEHGPELAAKHRILVIEDNVDAADMLSAVLERSGHQTDVAYTGPEGLAHARAFAPDVVVCDIGLPEMDGYAVARAIRADPELASVVLVALSGYGAPDDIAKARAAGFDKHLTKPISSARLSQVLATLTTMRG